MMLSGIFLKCGCAASRSTSRERCAKGDASQRRLPPLRTWLGPVARVRVRVRIRVRVRVRVSVQQAWSVSPT